MGWLSQLWGPGRQRQQRAESLNRINTERVRAGINDLSKAVGEIERAGGELVEAAAARNHQTSSLRAVLKDVIARVGSHDTHSRTAGR